MITRSFTTDLPEAPDIPTPRVGTISRNEATLTTMPFVRPTGQDRKNSIRYEWDAIGRDGAHHEFFQEFRPGPNLSLPGPTAGRVVMALLSISPGDISENLRVETHLNELARLCRLPEGGSTNRQLRSAIKRLQGVTIETNAFWDQRKKSYMGESTIELFSHHHVHDDGQKTAIEMEWTSVVATLMGTWSKPVNLDHLFDLDSCIARKLYQISALGIYQEGEMVEDLEILCHGCLGISESRKYPYQMKDSIRGPAEELRDNDLIDVQVKESPHMSSGWYVRARPLERMLEIYEDIDDPQYWACHLAGRGMLDLKDNPVKACRKHVDQNGVPRVRKIVKEYDRRRSPENDETPPKHPGWMQKMLCGEPTGDSSFPVENRIEDSADGPGKSEAEKVAAHLQMTDQEKYSRLRSRAQKQLKDSGQEADVDRVVGALYLKQEGGDRLPDHLNRS